ncbi:mitochondrial carrier domain-containing protein [Chaetomidium leptoderma]|uniref:Mitochondrial thiamine pyrophosphate carrier 1 n=1 Tax=Chaetomidium leptoderma TaxID=669021 RepID=A0AAN6ZU15_9PEZI|nr:mitochondrial carrier domain-containing protein [Chaetomidium leptoderma]
MPGVLPSQRPREAAGAPQTPVAARKEPAVCPTDDEAKVPRKASTDKQSFDYVWRSAVAGGLAGCAAKTVVAPLDRVKILFQSHNPHFVRYTGSWVGVGEAIKVIYRQDGPTGLYRGHSATLLRIFPYAAIKFLAYEQIRAIVIPRKDKETPFRRLISGSMAGVTSVFFTYPLEVIRVRLAFETKKEGRSSLRSICKQIYHEHQYRKAALPVADLAAASTSTARGAASAVATAAAPLAPTFGMANFYRGFTPTLLGMLPYAGMSFLTHDTAGDLLRHPMIAQYTTLPKPENAPPGKAAPLRSWAELLAGGIAGLVSQTSSYPLEVIRRRMQVGGAVGDGHRMRIGETAKLIMRERGFRGFFVGLTIGYAKVVPMVAASFYTYERLKTYLGI